MASTAHRSPTAGTLRKLAALLDLFERERAPLARKRIATALGASASSTAELLESLTDQGWLSFDRDAETYFPTARVAHWSSWLLDGRWLDPRVVEAARSLQQRTGETVSVSAPADLWVEVVFVAAQTGGIRFVIEVGQRLSLTQSAIGWAHCSTLPVATIRALAHRAAGDGEELSTARMLLRQARAARRLGYAHAVGAVIPDVAAWAAPLPRGLAARPLVLSIGGPAERMLKHRAQIVRALRGTIAALRRG
ncbi:MAG: helix-turn-helix domain-containing protein [Steroidobacteraceae bacterium]